MNLERVKNAIRTELNPITAEDKRDSKITFFIVSLFIAATAGIVGLSNGNPGGYIALGIAAISGIAAAKI